MVKKWLPLESNPEVMTEFASRIGLDTSKYAFHDVFGLDEVAARNACTVDLHLQKELHISLPYVSFLAGAIGHGASARPGCVVIVSNHQRKRSSG